VFEVERILQIETGKNKSIEIEYDMKDSSLDNQLMEYNGKKLTLSGVMVSYSDGSKYFRVSQSSFGPAAGASGTGKFTAVNKENEKAILLNGKTVYKSDEAFSLNIEKVFSIGNDKVALIQISSGAAACPANYIFITAKSGGALLVSKEFGNCSDLPKVTAKGEMISLRFPGNPPETWIYKNGNVKKGK